MPDEQQEIPRKGPGYYVNTPITEMSDDPRQFHPHILSNMDTLPGMGCSACSASVLPSAYFCPNCGKPLKAIPPATSVSRQIIVYLISFFIAPFGLWYAWKYLKQDDEKSRIIGVVAIALTIVAVAITIWTTAGLFNSVSQFLNSLSGLGL